MGIINVTHDSFFSASRAPDPALVRNVAERMVEEGAAILDVGGESSRPGSDYVSLQEELDRVVPAVREIRSVRPDVDISVDTRKSGVAAAALDAGATMINDISGLRDDPDLARVVAERGVPVCLMHMRGTPRTMQDKPRYDDLLGEIRSELFFSVDRALDAGIRAERIILDPGIGFGKTFDHNWHVLRELATVVSWGYSVLVGLSRKSFLGAPEHGDAARSLPPEERLHATLSAQIWCTLQGVSILRVHDVRPMVEAIRVFERLINVPRA